MSHFSLWQTDNFSFYDMTDFDPMFSIAHNSDGEPVVDLIFTIESDFVEEPIPEHVRQRLKERQRKSLKQKLKGEPPPSKSPKSAAEIKAIWHKLGSNTRRRHQERKMYWKIIDRRNKDA